MLSSSFHNIFLACVPLISFFSSNSTSYRCRSQMEACDFRHTQIKSLPLPLWENWERFLNSLLFSLVCVCVCYYITVFHRQQMLEGVRSSNTETHFLTVLCSDWTTSVGQEVHGWLLIKCRTLTYIHIFSLVRVCGTKSWFLCILHRSKQSCNVQQRASGQITISGYGLACGIMGSVSLQGSMWSIGVSGL